MAKVWSKGKNQSLDPDIERYEIGADKELDPALFKYELASSLAHAMMLEKIGVLNSKEFSGVRNEIRLLYKTKGDTILLEEGEEDIHSKLEALLTASLGETGKKIHTGRSRNDQVIVVTRLFEKERILKLGNAYGSLIDTVLRWIGREGKKILPGYTHTKQAMLMTAGFWAMSFVESGLDNLNTLENCLDLIDQNPLGSGSGFGVPLALDREMTTALLGFKRVQENAMYVQNSRGKFEIAIIDALWNIMHDFSRIAADMLTYNMDELLFIRTDAAITTGSSIMPQKRNLDVMELMRARTHRVAALSTELKSMVTGLHSGYNRDLQETKSPIFEAFDIVYTSVRALSVVFEHIAINEEAVKLRLSKGIFATDIAFRAVAEGMPFRDAYKKAAADMEKIVVNDTTIKESIDGRISPGAPATIDIEKISVLLSKKQALWKKLNLNYDKRFEDLLTDKHNG